MVPNPIRPDDVLAWCRIHRVSNGELVEDIWRVVHLVDLHRLAEARESRESESKSAKKRGRA